MPSYQPRQYGLVQPPAPGDPMRSLSELMNVMNTVGEMRARSAYEPVRREDAQSQIRERDSLTTERNAQTEQKQQTVADQDTINTILAQAGDEDTIIGQLRGTEHERLIPSIQRTFEEARKRKADFDHVVSETAKNVSGAERDRAAAVADDLKVKEAHANYLGGIGASIAEHGYSPAAFFHGVALAHNDKMLDPVTAGKMIALGIQTPDQIKPTVDAAIAASPEQRKYAADKAEKAATQAAETARRTRTITVTNPDGSTTERIVPDVPGTSYTSPPKASTLTAEQRATAERWKAGQLAALEREINTPGSALGPEQLNQRKLAIENSYRQQIGLQPLSALPAAWGATAMPPPVTPPSSSAPTGDKTVSPAEIQAIARRRGTTVEQEKARAAAAGYIVR